MPIWLLTIALLSAGACSREESLNPVRGKVLLKGKPLEGASVTFHPASRGADLDLPVGETAEDGTFSIYTGTRDGAPEGQYTVTIVRMTNPKLRKTKKLTTGSIEEVDQLRGAYANPTKPRITVEVKSGLNELEPFDLK